MIDVCDTKIIDELEDIELPNGYKLTRICIKEYNRNHYVDKSVDSVMTTPNGDKLIVLYDISMRFRNTHYKLTFITEYWTLPYGVWENIENALTYALKKVGY